MVHSFWSFQWSLKVCCCVCMFLYAWGLYVITFLLFPICFGSEWDVCLFSSWSLLVFLLLSYNIAFFCCCCAIPFAFDHGIVVSAASGLIYWLLWCRCRQLGLFYCSGRRRRHFVVAAAVDCIALLSFTGHLQFTMVLLFEDPWFWLIASRLVVWL